MHYNDWDISFIGGGNMATALIKGMLQQGIDAGRIHVCDINQDKLRTLKSNFRVHTHHDSKAALKHADIIFLAVKPGDAIKALEEIAAFSEKPRLLISVVAGLSLTQIQSVFKVEVPIIRSMPNMPALICQGATTLLANKAVNPQQKHFTENLFLGVGLALWLEEEKQFDAVTALSGSGPAYLFLMMEALINAAENLGLEKKLAKQLLLQTMAGSATLAIQSEHSLETLREQVTSKGGTTEAALAVLNQQNFSGLLKLALEAAAARSQQLGAEKK